MVRAKGTTRAGVMLVPTVNDPVTVKVNVGLTCDAIPEKLEFTSDESATVFGANVTKVAGIFHLLILLLVRLDYSALNMLQDSYKYLPSALPFRAFWKMLQV